jgi:hypothetical protein
MSISETEINNGSIQEIILLLREVGFIKNGQ